MSFICTVFIIIIWKYFQLSHKKIKILFSLRILFQFSDNWRVGPWTFPDSVWAMINSVPGHEWQNKKHWKNQRNARPYSMGEAEGSENKVLRLHSVAKAGNAGTVVLNPIHAWNWVSFSLLSEKHTETVISRSVHIFSSVWASQKF